MCELVETVKDCTRNKGCEQLTDFAVAGSGCASRLRPLQVVVVPLWVAARQEAKEVPVERWWLRLLLSDHGRNSRVT